MELMTVITSPPGSKHQRWHQGWRYLFHPDERLPPFAVVVALPLDDVTPNTREAVRTAPAQITVLERVGATARVEVAIAEGRHHQIRRLAAAI